ncbi:capsular polysaccharide export protein [Achromobacter deleyi]|jgi:capsular polysaccharide export protein|uniref:capsule biosynthesis protein n=1 Tax=Achromobacter deleyi TaxID=1353891 RepID=UPI002858F890|nr:capsular biosynthesis protein [Achromobacter deleyi]MDR6599649.1 capsular polysaccharide export protein [Achromobacter deleyi]
MRKRFLFLQGPCSPFFGKLGHALRDAGHDVQRVNFNAGDSWYWNCGKAFYYRSSADKLESWYANLMDSEGHTDIVLFGDQRPVHQPAIRLAKQRGIRVHVFEEGYFRPYWVTLERGGVNAHSQLPRDPAWYRRIGPRIPDYGNGLAFPPSFASRAWHDVVYHVAGIRNPLTYPGYRTHAPLRAHVEYASYLKRAATLGGVKRGNLAAIQSLIYSRTPFWLIPLQLGSDAQIRHHSTFESMRHVLEVTLDSFARMCRPDAVLVIKNHPLDTGQDDHAGTIAEICERVSLKPGRVQYLETGPLPALLNHARGVVTVNSTVGGSALVHGRPLKALGNAIYDMPGLTFQGELDAFWRYSKQPNQRLFRWFRNTVIHCTQVNGGLYSNESINLTIANALPRLTADHSPLDTLLA